MKIEISVKEQSGKEINLTYSHVDSDKEQFSAERTIVQLFGGRVNPVYTPENKAEEVMQEAAKKDLLIDRFALRAFLVGYYVDENGLAVNRKGESLGECIPGQFLRDCRNLLVRYHTVDSDGNSYLPFYNQEGLEAKRIYANDTEAIRTLLTKLEIPTGKAINSLYVTLTGRSTKDVFDVDGVDFSLLCHDIGKAILNDRSRHYSAYNGPLYVKEIMRRKISDYEALMRLKFDTIIQADSTDLQKDLSEAELSELACALNPQNWKTIFRSGDLEQTKKTLLEVASKLRRTAPVYQRNSAWKNLVPVLDLLAKKEDSFTFE